MPEERPALHVLFLSAEADPLIKVGGLADVAGSLPQALMRLDPAAFEGRRPEVRLVLPFHPLVAQRAQDLRPIVEFRLEGFRRDPLVRVLETRLGDIPVYVIDGDLMPHEGELYHEDATADAEKFIFFSLAALELPAHLGWPVDIVQANDWHSAISVYCLPRVKQDDPCLRNAHSLMVVHNLPYMGAGSEKALASFGIGESQDAALPDWARHLPLPMGLSAADRIVTVSPSYAREILTKEFGCGLETFLRSRQGKLVGILNGMDTGLWDPSTDNNITARFGVGDLERRMENKTSLLREFSLEEDAETPLLAMVSRMDPQKGIDLALEALDQLRYSDWQAILLGTGAPDLEEAARRLEKQTGGRLRAVTRVDPQLSHRLYAGADILLMPSRYEPCGISQMIAMRYGCVPVVRSTGGLKDTVVDASEGEGTGFTFKRASADALRIAMRRAFKARAEPVLWRGLQSRGMARDFSWRESARSYARLYTEIIADNTEGAQI